MKPIVLFGTGKIAEVLLYFFRNHSEREVAAVTVDREYMPGTTWEDLPVVAFDEVTIRFPPTEYDLFVALGYQGLNSLRAKKVAEARDRGYALPSYIHPQSGLPSDCVYGDNCFIMNHVLIHPCVRLGHNVFVWSGAMIGHHTTVGDNCWLTSCSNISGVVTVGKNCFFAVNGTVGHGITIGDDCFIGANALVTKCAEAGKVYVLQATQPLDRLNSTQFLRMSTFSDL